MTLVKIKLDANKFAPQTAIFDYRHVKHWIYWFGGTF